MTRPLRIPVYDNAKFVMIFLVVLGHMIEPFITMPTFVQKAPIFKTLYLFIYSFHMPVFIMISGIFSSEKSDSEGVLYRLSLYIISFIISISVLTLIPNKTILPSHWAQNTLYVYLWHGLLINVYLWHGLLIKAAIALGLTAIVSSWNPFILLAALTMISVFLTISLSLKLISSSTEKFMLMPLGRILKA